ncbi:MAG: histidine phosphatase family protein [Chlamydiales bacterium]|nr:histidine phosphatase family protein [Chlamydiales bacterium]
MAPKHIYLCRHGETEWTLSGQHTSSTDLELTKNGIHEAKCLKKALKGIHFDSIFSSPLKRATETAKLAGYPAFEVEEGLFEWRYGKYEGMTSKRIKESDPNWNIFEKGAPEGESVEDVQERTERLCAKLRELEGNVLLFSSGHISRAIGAVWAGMPVHHGKYLVLSTASLSILGYEHDYPVIRCWNNLSHLH